MRAFSGRAPPPALKGSRRAAQLARAVCASAPSGASGSVDPPGPLTCVVTAAELARAGEMLRWLSEDDEGPAAVAEDASSEGPTSEKGHQGMARRVLWSLWPVVGTVCVLDRGCASGVAGRRSRKWGG